MEHTNFQAQAGTALRYEYDQSQVTKSRFEAYENSSLWEVSNCGDQRVLDADCPPAQSADAVAERRSGDDVSHEMAKERKTVDGSSINNPAENLNRQMELDQRWRQAVQDGSYIDQLKCALMYLRLKLSKTGWGIVWGITFLAESVRCVR
jgi:hypothetical protein